MMQKIRGAIALFIANLRLFSAIVLTVWLPGSVLAVYLRLYVLPDLLDGDEMRVIAQEFRITSLIEFVFSPFYAGAMLYAASRLKQGFQPSYGESLSYAARRSFKLLTTRLTTGLIVLVGLIALVIPGIVLLLHYALVDSVVVLEGAQGAIARSRSNQLTRGKRWSILGAIVLSYIGLSIIIALVSFVLYLPVSLVGQTDNFFVSVLYECIASVLLALPILILFLYYWEAKHPSPTDTMPRS